ncbi:hypothetical protein HanPSC8_Chr01g0032261 [Helianthus annuus]|nr:hypothetical protein HanPSC8_Chr01g0032261 [Helianthus annuus]
MTIRLDRLFGLWFRPCLTLFPWSLLSCLCLQHSLSYLSCLMPHVHRRLIDRFQALELSSRSSCA